jgi:hypothetical protein
MTAVIDRVEQQKRIIDEAGFTMSVADAAYCLDMSVRQAHYRIADGTFPAKVLKHGTRRFRVVTASVKSVLCLDEE